MAKHIPPNDNPRQHWHLRMLTRDIKNPEQPDPVAVRNLMQLMGGSPVEMSDDGRSITIRGRTWPLTPDQSEVVRILFEAYQTVRPDVALATIQGGTSTETHPRHRFRSLNKAEKAAGRPNAWLGSLVVKGSRKDTFRLNV